VALSPDENQFLNSPAPAPQQVTDSVWRYEALYLLEWALKLADDLALPTHQCDVQQVAGVMFADHATLVATAELRPAEEILDALDLHFRLHWAVAQRRLEKRAVPASLVAGVVSERHYALNWLVRFEDAEWDSVDTPT
jgi:hypothetical protein